MPRRLWAGVAALALGVALLVTAQLASASRGFKQSGIFNYGTAGASVQIDPQLAYVTTAWWLEYATAAKLFNYPDRRGQAGALLRPEVASSYRVSRDGRTWTFVVRRGFRFSDGSPVTARSFAYAIDRAASHDLASPAAPFITDPNGTNIVGARAVNEGKAPHVRGVIARGNHLTIRLTRRDPTLLTKLAMPFFQATSTALPPDREVLTGYPSAGTYFFKSHDPNVKTELRRNRYYGGSRVRHLSGVDVTWNVDAEHTAYTEWPFDNVFPIADTEVPAIVEKYGVNKTRFWVEPMNCTGYLAMNSERPLLKNNAPLRKAISWVVDRRKHLELATPYSGSPWTHLLPPTFPGSVTAPSQQPYAAGAEVAKARRLAAGHLRSGKVVIGYPARRGLAEPELLRDELVRLGFKAENVTFKLVEPWDGGPGTLAMPYDIDGVPGGWCSDYLDPETFLAPLLYFTPARGLVDVELAKIRRLATDARMHALGRLDVRLMRDLAPIVGMRTYNSRYLFSSRVDPRSLVYSDPYSDWSIPALALK